MLWEDIIAFCFDIYIIKIIQNTSPLRKVPSRHCEPQYFSAHQVIWQKLLKHVVIANEVKQSIFGIASGKALAMTT